MKKQIAILIVLFLVGFEAYLIISSALEKDSKQKEIALYCKEKCNYNAASYMWEFSGNYAVKGFTTKDECNSYCAKVKQGFAYKVLEYLEESGTAFAGKIFKK